MTFSTYRCLCFVLAAMSGTASLGDIVMMTLAVSSNCFWATDATRIITKKIDFKTVNLD